MEFQSNGLEPLQGQLSSRSLVNSALHISTEDTCVIRPGRTSVYPWPQIVLKQGAETPVGRTEENFEDQRTPS